MNRTFQLAVACGVGMLFAGGLLAWAQDKKAMEDGERKVKEAEVPKAAESDELSIDL